MWKEKWVLNKTKTMHYCEKVVLESKNTTINKRTMVTDQKFGLEKCGEIKKKEKHETIEYKFSIKKKGLNIVLEELKKEYMLRPSK